MKNEKTAIVIPARFKSSRLEGKPLLMVNGKPVIQYVYERALEVSNTDTVIVATDDEKIFETAKKFGADVEMTSNLHKSGSDRIAEVAKRHDDFEYIINLQGDEPLFDVKSVETLIEVIKSSDQASIATMVRPIFFFFEFSNPNVVKCVFDLDNFALYFSRSLVPYPRNVEYSRFFAHIGIYAYKREALLNMTSLSQSPLEKAESLEQLRALENGMKIKVLETSKVSIGIDTKEDFEKFKQLLEAK